jgi:hypothetical protein
MEFVSNDVNLGKKISTEEIYIEDHSSAPIHSMKGDMQPNAPYPYQSNPPAYNSVYQPDPAHQQHYQQPPYHQQPYQQQPTMYQPQPQHAVHQPASAGRSGNQSGCQKCIECLCCCTLCATCFIQWCQCCQIIIGCCEAFS